MKIYRLIFVFLFVFQSYYLFGQSQEIEADTTKVSDVDSTIKVEYDYEKYKAAFVREMERLEERLEADTISYREDTISKEPVNLARYFSQFKNPKLGSKDFNIIISGNSKSELFVNFLSHISIITEKFLPSNLYGLNYNLGNNLFIKSSNALYYIKDKINFDYSANIFFKNGTSIYFISTYESLNESDFDIQRVKNFTIYKISDTDTSIISKLSHPRLSYLEENNKFNKAIESYLSNLGFRLEFDPVNGYGIFSISKKHIRKLQKTEPGKMPHLPDFRNNEEWEIEFNLRIEKIKEENHFYEINEDYEEFKRTFDKEMKKLENEENN